MRECLGYIWKLLCIKIDAWWMIMRAERWTWEETNWLNYVASNLLLGKIFQRKKCKVNAEKKKKKKIE